MIELLAPAKNKECAFAAIDCGADAVYIGASNFGARKNVPNSLEDIKEVVEYAHKFNAKVYITINTILTDEELKRANELIFELEEIGVDAIIVQDMGLLEAKRQRGKDAKSGCHCESKDEAIQKKHLLEFHASTQCDIRTPEKVKFLESVGFTRVVLARELSIEQIKEIKSQTNVELEAFIHGALCVSYSGQCYLSEMIGGRSANRGECAQPCRKKYSLGDENGIFIAKNKYLLNLKDFNASKYIKDLADAGVTSFKIEGRLKDENYVRNVVGYYRKLIDDLGLKKSSSGKINLDFEPNLEKSFNRGFTDYFLEKRKDCYSFDSPKSIGEYIGKVKKVSVKYFEIEFPSIVDKDLKTQTKAQQLSPQDGVCFYNKEVLCGCLVNKVEEIKDRSRSGAHPQMQRVYPNKIDGLNAGTEIYRNVDCEFEKALKNSKATRKISANIVVDIKSIKIVDEDNNSTEISYTFEEFAQNEKKMIDNIQTQLKKSGDSVFLIQNVQVATEKPPFLPISKINELRRELLEKLASLRVSKASVAIKKQESDELLRHYIPRKDELTLDYRANIMNKSAQKFYEELGFKITEQALESEKVQSAGKVAMTCKHCLKYAFNMCKSKDAPQKLYLIDEKGKRYELNFNCDKCEMEIIF